MTNPQTSLETTNNLAVRGAFNSGTAAIYLSHGQDPANAVSTFIGYKAAILAPAAGLFGRSTEISFALNSANDSTNATIADAKVTILENGNLCVGSSSAGNAGTINVSVGNPGTTVGGLQLWSTTSATHYVHFGDSASGADPYRGYVGYGHASDAMVFGTASTQRMQLDATNGLQIGTNAGNCGANGIHVTGVFMQGASGLSQQQITISGGNTIQSQVLGVGYYPLYLQTLGSNLIVGTTSTALLGLMTVSYNTNDTSNPTLLVRNGGGSAAFVTFSDSGASTTIYGSITRSGSNTSYNTSSDYRLKNITGALTGYKERLMSLQPKQGTWIVDGAEFRGFLAHEFAEPYRTSVTGEKDAVDEKGKPVMQGMQASSSEVMADLVALVQEQQAIIESLKARLDAANL
jgi:hypothetical protein